MSVGITFHTDARLENMVKARDICLSGWGRCDGSTSWIGWMCCDAHLNSCLSWARNRSDTRNVHIASSKQRHRGNGFLSIYLFHGCGECA